MSRIAFFTALTAAAALAAPAGAAPHNNQQPPGGRVYAHNGKNAVVTGRDVVKVPRHARVLNARLTVVKNGATIARNVPRKRLPHDQTYRVSATVRYRPLLSREVPTTHYVNRSDAVTVEAEACRVTSRRVTWDRTTSSWGGWEYYLHGQVTLSYAGSCTGLTDDWEEVDFTASWDEDAHVFIDPYEPTDPRETAILRSGDVHRVGDIVYYPDATGRVTVTRRVPVTRYETRRYWGPPQTVHGTRNVHVVSMLGV